MTIEERKQKYGCNGLCYGGKNEHGQKCSMCGGVDTCDETRIDEGFATFVGLVVIVFGTPIMAIILLMLIN